MKKRGLGKSKFELFLLEKKAGILWWLWGLAVFFAILHNVVYGLIGFEESVFFTLSLLSGLGFVVFLIYISIAYIKKQA
jgi:hypothetical protein